MLELAADTVCARLIARPQPALARALWPVTLSIWQTHLLPSADGRTDLMRGASIILPT